jgi:hypothetical protein
MAARVVCISKTDAALGESIGDLVAKQLGFRYVDEQVIERAARLAKVDPKLVAKVEQRQSLLSGLLDKLAAARDLVGPATLGALSPVFAGTSERGGQRATPEDLRLLVRAAIQEIASAGDAVIVAHAASIALATRDDVVRVLVTASAATRAKRLAVAQEITEEAAAAAIANTDRNRRDYFQRFYEIAQELPTHYDLVVNTDVLGPAQAAELIVCAARVRP